MARWALQYALCIAVLFAGDVLAQPGVRRLDLRGRVLDALFKPHTEAKPYSMKLVMRFGDRPSQLTVVTNVGGATEVRRLELVRLNSRQLDDLIAGAVGRDSQVSPEQLAAQIAVQESRTEISYSKLLDPLLTELKRVRISPILSSRVAVDDYTEYEFVYDQWQESVRYTVVGPFTGHPQDDLVKWMLKFRARADEWLNNQKRQ
jgi:hypothetical protein